MIVRAVGDGLIDVAFPETPPRGWPLSSPEILNLRLPEEMVTPADLDIGHGALETYYLHRFAITLQTGESPADNVISRGALLLGPRAPWPLPAWFVLFNRHVPEGKTA